MANGFYLIVIILGLINIIFLFLNKDWGGIFGWMAAVLLAIHGYLAH